MMWRLNKIFVLLLSVLLVIISCTSCTSTRSSAYFQAQTNAFEETGEDFIELISGKIIRGKITKNNLAYGKGRLVVNGNSYPSAEIRAYQDDRKYFRKDPLNDFDQRIIKGEISVYRFIRTSSTTNGHGSSTTHYNISYFLQKGKNGELVVHDVNELRRMIQDYQPAVDEFSKYEALTDKQKITQGNDYIMNIISLYNKKN